MPLVHFFRQSGKQNNKLKLYVQNNFTIYDEWNPNNIKGDLKLLDKYTKYSVIQHTTSEGKPFYQKGGAINKPILSYDIKYWGTLECF